MQYQYKVTDDLAVLIVFYNVAYNKNQFPFCDYKQYGKVYVNQNLLCYVKTGSLRPS